MKRSIIIGIVLALFAVLAPQQPAYADGDPPTKEQLEAAKKAFGEGRALFDEGKLAEAVEKFKESYRLSRNPVLLYNIGFTLDQAGSKDKALFYYRKFLADAPKDASQRKEVTKRVDVIEKENLEADLAGTTTTTTPTKTEPTKTEPKTATVKPAGTYSQADFQHQMVDAAPPGKPLDLTAFVPEDSGFTVTLFFRGGGEAKFVQKPMRWRYKELVARIPAARMAGNSVQYYLEVKDQAGNRITTSGKSTSPNIVYLEADASPRFYPDLADDSDGTPEQTAAVTTRRRSDDEDPFGKSTPEPDPDPVSPTEPSAPGTGFTDVGSSKFNKAKWITTGIAGAAVGGAVVTFILAKKQASNLEADSTSCGAPPCRMFDLDYDKAVEDAGKRYNTIHTVTTIVGVAAVGVAGYFWYKELTGKKRGEVNAGRKKSAPEMTWAITPSISDGYTGAAAAARF